MKILIAPNAFKESLTARGAARAMARGFRRALPKAELVEIPVADGGDGTAEAILRAIGGASREFSVTGPLGLPVRARIARLKNQDEPTDLIEMAQSAGLALVPPSKRNPMLATSFGFGELIAIARRRGARRIIAAIGGSATVDGGAGMAQALGFRLLDASGGEVAPGGQGLGRVARIVAPEEWAAGSKDRPQVVVVTDVKNPLLGRGGAAAVFGPQKGATPAMIPKLEAGLKNLARRVERDVLRGSRPKLAELEGGGSAGGMGAGLAGFLDAELRPGAELVLDLIRFDAALRGADWVVTGEGRLDRQTLGGKAPAAVARAAAKRGIPVIGLAGSVEPELAMSERDLRRGGWTALFSIAPGPATLEESFARAEEWIEARCFQIGRLLALSPPRRRPN